MAKIVPVERKADHALRIRSDSNEGELLLVKGASPYLWVGQDKTFHPITISGTKTLLRLAAEINKLLAK